MRYYKQEKFPVIKGPDKEKELTEATVLIEKPEAKYRIIYGYHGTEQKPEDLGKAEALVLESGFGNYSTPQEAEFLFKEIQKNIKQYERLIEKAAKEKKPIFLADISDSESIMIFQVIIGVLESVSSVPILYSLLEDVREIIKEKKLNQKKLNRRDFIKTSAKGLIGFYLSTPFLEVFLNTFSDFFSKNRVNLQSKSENLNRFLTELNEKIHPEIYAIILTLRNYLLAQKMETIAQTLKKKNKKPEIAIVVGASHYGIEKALQKEKNKRIELINFLTKLPGLEESRKRIATIARFDFDEKEKNWKVTQIFKDPLLVPLEK